MLEEENRKLKQRVADLSVDKQILQDGLRKTLGLLSNGATSDTSSRRTGCWACGALSHRCRSVADEQAALRMRLRELAAARVSYAPHPTSHRGRLVLRRRHPRCLLPPRDRVGKGRAPDHGISGQRSHDGRPEPVSRSENGPPLRPRRPVRGAGLWPHAAGGRAAGIHGATAGILSPRIQGWPSKSLRDEALPMRSWGVGPEAGWYSGARTWS